MMTLKEYKNLPDKMQYSLLWKEGVLVDSYFELKVRKLLFALNNFYVELWYEINTNKILWKLSFKQGKLLEKYLDKYDFKFTSQIKNLY